VGPGDGAWDAEFYEFGAGMDWETMKGGDFAWFDDPLFSGSFSWS
jgi:hypothetical protein